MKLANFSTARSVLMLGALFLPLQAQTNLQSLSSVVYVKAPEKITVLDRSAVTTADFTIQVKNGYHVNSNTPSDEYLIPLRLTFNQDVVKIQEVVFPKPAMEKFQFSDKPVSVFQGDIKTQAKFRVAANAPKGLTHLIGKLRYQACNDRMCLPPRTLEIKVPLEIRN